MGKFTSMIEDAATGGISSAIGQGLGMVLGGLNDKRQLQQQQKLTDQQVEANKKIGAFNQQNAKEMWDYTNYENQVKHMQEAGLNVGLMYGGAGQGGSTTGGTASGVSGGVADGGVARTGLGMQLASQLALQKAQAELS